MVDLPTVPCKTCSKPTTHTGSKDCTNCHEVEMRLYDYVRDGGEKALAKLRAYTDPERPHCKRDPSVVGCCGGTDETCSCECNTCEPPDEPRPVLHWRVGRSLGRTLYKDNVCIGMVDTPELATEIARKMNRGSR